MKQALLFEGISRRGLTGWQSEHRDPARSIVVMADLLLLPSARTRDMLR
jgi:hypothetical protein